MSHFLQAGFYGNDVQMPSGLNWLPVITEPPPGGWEKEPWIENRGLILNDPPGPLFDRGILSSQSGPRRPFWSPAIHPFCSLWFSRSPCFPLSTGTFIPIPWVMYSYHNMFLCLMFPLAVPSVKQGKLLLVCQAPNHTSSCRKHPQSLFCTPAEQYIQLSHST